MGCLLVLLGGVFPRLALFIVWVARPKMVDAAFSSWSSRYRPTKAWLVSVSAPPMVGLDSKVFRRARRRKGR